MISNYMTQEDVVNELKARTGFYKQNIRDVLDALEDIIVESMNTATFDTPSEMRLFFGWRLGAKRTPEHLAYDPRNRNQILTPEKLLPYCKFKKSFKERVNADEEIYDDEESLDE